jgi:arylsulfatase A-like enzyme
VASADTVPSAAASATPTAAPASPLAGAPERPDLLLVTLDTVGARHCSAYGYERATTPSLAALASRGVLFAHAYAPGTTTQAALTPLVTGRLLADSRRGTGEWPTLTDENDTVAERLERAGYATGAVVSFTWLRKDKGFAQGFDAYDESAYRDAHPERESTGEQALAAAREVYASLAKGDAPLFLWVHLFDAHAKYLEHPGVTFGKSELDRYDGEVAFVDRQLGELVRTVEAGPRAARTLWLVHGSHGEAFGEHRAQGHGTELYDETLQVPFVLSSAWATPWRYEAEAVSTLDVAATLLDAAKGERAELAGTSLLSSLGGSLTLERAAVLAYGHRKEAVVDWPLKLLVRKREGAADRLLLFDLAADPREERDVAGERKEELARLDALRPSKGK